MSQSPKPIYCPALRMKAGELEGVRQLAPDVANCVLPRFIVPPQGERDETTPSLFDAAPMPDIASPLSMNWRERSVLIDCTHIIDEYGRNRLMDWLPPMFARAREGGARAIPVALLSDIGDAESLAFRAAIASSESIKFAIRVPSGEMVGSEFSGALKSALDRLRLKVEDCAVLADFGRSEFDDPAIVAPIISGSLETLQDFGRWRHIIFQGTHYPESNPAKDGTAEICRRNEWLAWREAVNFDPNTAEYMIFGDYAADCAKMDFSKASGAAAIRHVRYATSEHWRVQRAVKVGSDAVRMRGVYRAIFDSADFAGSGFSAADAFIARAANDANVKPGNPQTWRQLNTTHHITQVVSDIAKVRGVLIKQTPSHEVESQMSLLP